MNKAKLLSTILMAGGLIVLISLNVMSADFDKVWESAMEPGRYHLGPFEIFPAITLDSLGYTDNIFRYSDVAQPGWMADLGLKIKAVSTVGRRLVLVLQSHPYYSYFSAKDTERAFNHTFEGRAYTRLAGIHLMYGIDSSSRRSRPNREFAARVRYKYTTHHLEADIGNHAALFLTFYANWSKLGFSDEYYYSQYDLSKRLNRTINDWGFMINLPVFTATLLSLQVELEEYRFDESSLLRDGNSLVTALNIRFPEIGHLTGSASLGYKRYLPDNPEYAEFDTLYGSGRVTYRFLRHWRLGLEYTLDNYFSFIDPKSYFNQKSFQAALDYYMSKNFRLGFSFQLGRYDYRQQADGTLQYREKDQFLEFRAVYRLTGTTGIGVTFRRGAWDSQYLDLQHSYYFIGGFVTYDF